MHDALAPLLVASPGSETLLTDSLRLIIEPTN
jgi:hypothetical protein